MPDIWGQTMLRCGGMGEVVNFMCPSGWARFPRHLLKYYSECVRQDASDEMELKGRVKRTDPRPAAGSHPIK